MKKFLKSLDELFMAMMMLNTMIAFEWEPDLLKRLPLVLAVPVWLALSVLWVVPIGLITLAVEAVLAVHVIYTEMYDECKGRRWLVVPMFIVYYVGMGLQFVLCRFIGCAAAFKEGIYEPRRREMNVYSMA